MDFRDQDLRSYNVEDRLSAPTDLHQLIQNPEGSTGIPPGDQDLCQGVGHQGGSPRVLSTR